MEIVYEEEKDRGGVQLERFFHGVGGREGMDECKEYQKK